MAQFQQCLDKLTAEDKANVKRVYQQHQERIVKIREEINDKTLHENERTVKQSLLKEYESQLETFEPAIRSLIDASDSTNQQLENKRLPAIRRETNRLELHLPIYARRDDIINAVRKNRVLILNAETGAGKSTQVVQYLADSDLADHGEIVCSQPRKFAARALVDHVAKEFGCRVGEEIGIHLDAREPNVSKLTKVRFVTENVLLNQYRQDPMLSSYSIVIIDEAHERNIDTDLLLGLMKLCLAQQPNMKLIIMSATLDTKLISNYYPGSHVLEVAGRTYPIEDEFIQRNVEDYVNEAIQKVYEIHRSNQPGDILVFLTGPDEIDRAVADVQRNLKDTVKVLPLHGKLQTEEMAEIFEKTPSKRKIIFSTNMAETSVTIDGVQHVIDSGMVKEMIWDEKQKMQVLKLGRTTQNSVKQRRGRAGRTSSGKCYHLYTEKTLAQMDMCPLPEILRTEPIIAVLKLKYLGVVDNVENFHWVQAPSNNSIRHAVHRLRWLNAIDLKSNQLTETGHKMAQLGFSPMLSAMILDSLGKPCINHVLVLAGMLSVSSDVWWRPKDSDGKLCGQAVRTYFFQNNGLGGDFIMLLRIFLEWQAVEEDRRVDWCKKNTISAKALNRAWRFVKETARQLKTAWPKFNGTTIEQNLINEIMSCVRAGCFQNLGILRQSSRDTYTVSPAGPGEPTIEAKIHKFSSLYSVEPKPRYVLYHCILNLNHLNLMMSLCPITLDPKMEAWRNSRCEKPVDCNFLSSNTFNSTPTSSNDSISKNFYQHSEISVKPRESETTQTVHEKAPISSETTQTVHEKAPISSETTQKVHEKAPISSVTSVKPRKSKTTQIVHEKAPMSSVTSVKPRESETTQKVHEKAQISSAASEKQGISESTQTLREKPETASLTSVKPGTSESTQKVRAKSEISNEINAENWYATKMYHHKPDIMPFLVNHQDPIFQLEWNTKAFLDQLGHSRITGLEEKQRLLRMTVMLNTIGIVRKGTYRVDDKKIQLQSNQLKTIHYNHQSLLQQSSVIKSLSDLTEPSFALTTTIRVVNEDRLIVYKKLVSEGLRPVFLNMACPTCPAGGYRQGIKTQEATLFYRSNYFQSLDVELNHGIPSTHYYCNWNGDLKPLSKYDNMYPMDEFGAIYTSGLTIFREPEENGYALMDVPLTNMCTIAISAYNDSKLNSENRLTSKYSIGMRKKIENIFAIAYHQKHDCLVLSAFGCGKFENPPNHVAEIFKSVIQQYAGFFKYIYFAIVDDYHAGQYLNPYGNYQPFKKLLDNRTVESLRPKMEDMMIGPWRISHKTINGEICLRDVRIYSGPLCNDGGECKDLKSLKHCTEYSHPPICPFMIDGTRCEQKFDRDHMLWFRHDIVKRPHSELDTSSQPVYAPYSDQIGSYTPDCVPRTSSIIKDPYNSPSLRMKESNSNGNQLYSGHEPQRIKMYSSNQSCQRFDDDIQDNKYRHRDIFNQRSSYLENADGQRKLEGYPKRSLYNESEETAPKPLKTSYTSSKEPSSAIYLREGNTETDYTRHEYALSRYRSMSCDRNSTQHYPDDLYSGNRAPDFLNKKN